MAFIKRAKRPFTSFTNDPSVSRKTHSSIITVSLWSLTTIHWLTAQAAAYRLWKLPAHFEIHNAEEKARQPQLCGAQRQARKERDELGAAQPAPKSRVGKRGRPRRSWQRLLAKKREPSLRLGPRSAPRRKPAWSDHAGETRLSSFPWPPRIAETPPLLYEAAGALPYPAARQSASWSPRRRAPLPTPRSVCPRRSAASRKPGFHGIPSPRRLPPPAGSHLRGAPVAELVGDGLDAPSPGHRDVAALRAHVQPHYRHGRLSVRLRLGSVWVWVCVLLAAAAGPGRAWLPWGPLLSRGRTDGHTDSLPVWHLRLPGDSGGSQSSSHGRRCSVSASRSGARAAGLDLPPLAHRRAAELPTQKGRSQSLSLMYLTDRNFPESAAFTHRRLHRPLHVLLPLPSSRAFSKDSTQWVVGPSGYGCRCHGSQKATPALLAQAGQTDPPTPPSALARGSLPC